MKIYGIDANVLTRKKKTGTERYVLSLLQNMMKIPLHKNERVLLYLSEAVEELENLPKGWEVKILSWLPKKAWTHLRLSFELRFHKLDVFFSPAHEIPLFMGRTRIVATVHDVAFRALPELYSSSAYKRQDWSVRRQIKVAQKILTVSESTKKDLEHFYSVPSEKITPTLLAVDQKQFKVSKKELKRVLAIYNLKPHSYFVTIGRLEKKKNIAFLIRAFSKFAEKSDVELVLGGSFGFGKEEIQEEIKLSSAKNKIKVLGYVPDSDLPALIAGSAAYVFPTNYEGFGIPALEAMAAGTALLASDIPALREVAANAALFADPKDLNSWVQLMQEVLLQRDSLIENGYERLQRFSWENTAEKTWKVLRSL